MALGTLRLLALLPFSVQLALGRALGGILRRLPVRFVSIARRNIDLCLPELDSAERERLLDRHFASLGIALMEIALAWWSPAARLREMAQVEGLERVRKALERGRGVI
ncbi:Bacterial lipid A biosynthesis acyltransferase, partial [mine drainage metagenome]